MKYMFVKIVATIVIIVTSTVAMINQTINFPMFFIFFCSLLAIIASDYIELYLKYIKGDEINELKQQIKDIDMRIGLRGL